MSIKIKIFPKAKYPYRKLLVVRLPIGGPVKPCDGCVFLGKYHKCARKFIGTQEPSMLWCKGLCIFKSAIL